jgi:NAD(P)-dependent dehydrogenase (short-subunit alcohol dehydrogenase family)
LVYGESGGIDALQPLVRSCHPQPLNITDRRGPKHPRILPAELGWTFITHPIDGRHRVVIFRQHEPTGFHQSALLLILQLNDGGRIVNISTGLTRMILPGYAAYASMKGAIETLNQYMAKELGARRIAVNVVAPGAIETDFGGAVRDNPSLNQHLASITALGRVGLPDDIGGAIASLLSEDNQWVNAQRIEVSGGQSI